MKTNIRVIGVACLTGAAGLVAAGSLVLSAPATGVSSQCAAALQAASANAPAALAGGTVPAGLASCAQGGVPAGLPVGGIAVNGSVVSGNGIAVNGSTSSGCSIAAEKSTASGGNCAPAAAPAKAVGANPSFAG